MAIRGSNRPIWPARHPLSRPSPTVYVATVASAVRRLPRHLVRVYEIIVNRGPFFALSAATATTISASRSAAGGWR